jgi:hypothetical protein
MESVFHMIKSACLNSTARQDRGRIDAHLSKQARNDNQAAYPLVAFVGACQPTLLRMIEPPTALALIRDSRPVVFVR